MIRDFFIGFIKIHILYHASENAICGIEMIKELKRHGYPIGPGTIYPTLHSLEIRGYLKSKEVVINGKRRKYYEITGKGFKMLEKSKEKIGELVEEVL
ncbi:MAG: PadR family transcriptional regulator [Euryarchaeota archaeon]|nr:PadR family transcriptional regulator [Euryarchaeota archaeon]